MVRNQRTERVHRALRQFLTPKLRPGADVEFTPLFYGVDDTNIAARIDDVIGGAIRLTAGDLVYDASTPALRAKLKEAVDEPQPDGTSKGGEVDQSIIDRVLQLLEMRLTPTELQAVKAILMQPAKGKSAYDPGATTAEDAKNAQLALDAYAGRFPNAAKIRVEPSTAPAPQRQTATPDVAGYYSRFPNAQRIGF